MVSKEIAVASVIICLVVGLTVGYGVTQATYGPQITKAQEELNKLKYAGIKYDVPDKARIVKTSMELGEVEKGVPACWITVSVKNVDTKPVKFSVTIWVPGRMASTVGVGPAGATVETAPDKIGEAKVPILGLTTLPDSLSVTVKIL